MSAPPASRPARASSCTNSERAASVPTSTLNVLGLVPRKRGASLSIPLLKLDLEVERLLRGPPNPSPRSPMQQTTNIDTLPLAPIWPTDVVLRRLHKLLLLEGKALKEHLDYDDVRELEEMSKDERRRLVECRDAQQAMRKGEWNALWSDNSPFEAPIPDVAFWASTTIIMNGARHEIPTVMFACIEELYRTGMYQQNLLRQTPNLRKHAELFGIFNTAPSFGHGRKLSGESTPDVASLLSTFLRNMRQPILSAPIRAALWALCVAPAVERRRALKAAELDEDEDIRARVQASGQPLQRSESRALAARRRALAEDADRQDAAQVPAAQCLLRLLPTARLSSLYYLCAFFSQIPLCPENGLSLGDIAEKFAEKIVGGPGASARPLLVWILQLWSPLSEGLLDADMGPDPVNADADDVEMDDVVAEYARGRADSRSSCTTSESTLANTGSESGEHDDKARLFDKGDAGYFHFPSADTVRTVSAHARTPDASPRRSSRRPPLRSAHTYPVAPSVVITDAPSLASIEHARAAVEYFRGSGFR